MSVVKNKRTESQLEVVTRARELAAYTIKICSNEKNFPKRYRWCITNKIVDSVIEINNRINKANSIYVKTDEDFKIRRDLQVEAISETYGLLTMMDIAYSTFSVESKRVDHWTGLVLALQGLLRSWRDSDFTRYGK